MTLQEIYEAAERDIADSPSLFCQRSGRCCLFREAGHELFLTRLEFEEMVRRGGPRPPVLDVCPWLDGRLCGNREGRALACRTYFCSDEPAAAAVTEKWHAEIRRLHERLGRPYAYLSLADHLRMDPPRDA